MKSYIQDLVIGALVFDSLLVLLAFLTGAMHFHALWTGVAAFYAAKCLFVRKFAMNGFHSEASKLPALQAD